MTKKYDIPSLKREIDSKSDTEKIVHLTSIVKELNKESDEIIKKSVYEILDGLTQSKYERLIRRNLTFGIERLHKITDIVPDLSDETVQSAYMRLIKNPTSRFAQKIKIIHNVTKIKPILDDGIVQQLYEGAIKKENISDFEILKTVFGIKPRDDLALALDELYKSRKDKLREIKSLKD